MQWNEATRPPESAGEIPSSAVQLNSPPAGVNSGRPDQVPHQDSRGDRSSSAAAAYGRRLLIILSLLVSVRIAVPPAVEEIQYRLTRGRQRAEYETAGRVLDSIKLENLSAAFQLVSQRAGPSVVHIDTVLGPSLASRQDHHQGTEDSERSPRSERDSMLGPDREQGSGVIVDPDGYVITNHHVVASADQVLVTLSDGRRVKGKVIGSDWLTDMAVLKIEADGLIAADWGDSDRLREGALVWAMGSPYGLKCSITSGIVSAKSLAGFAGRPYQDYLQTDAAVNPGSSGGPLVNVQGKIVGINTAIIGESYRGITFAVPSNIAKRVYERLRNEGRVSRGWLGVVLDDVTAQQAQVQKLSQSTGAIVRAVGFRGVGGNCPAAEAGIQEGDVIVSWGGQPVDRKETLIRAVAQTDIGARVQMEIVREGRSMTIEITVGERPELTR